MKSIFIIGNSNHDTAINNLLRYGYVEKQHELLDLVKRVVTRDNIAKIKNIEIDVVNNSVSFLTSFTDRDQWRRGRYYYYEIPKLGDRRTAKRKLKRLQDRNYPSYTVPTGD